MKQVIVFSAVWCNPCQQYKPIVDEATKEIEAKGYSVSRVTLDDSEESNLLAEKYNVKSIPTTIVVKDEVVEAFQGKMSKEDLLSKL